MNAKRLFAMLLAALMLASTVACGNAPAEKETTADTAVSGETEAETEGGRSAVSDDLPDKDFGGQTFNAMIPDWTARYMVAEEMTGEVLNDALYNRDRMVEDRFNAKVTFEIVDELEQVGGLVASGDDVYQVVSSGIVALGRSVQQGWYLDASEIPYLNFEKPWYPSEVTEAMSYKGRTFIFISDYSVSNMSMTECMLYNNDLAEEYSLESIYDVVMAGEWTIDKMEEMITGVYKDVNGDGTADEGDRYGLALDFKGDPSTIPFHLGHRILEKQDDGTFKDIFYDEDMINMVEWMYNLTHNNENVSAQDAWNHGFNMFATANTLMSYIRIDMITWGLRDLDIDYALIPRPMYNEDQDKYYSTLAGSADALVFLKTVQDKEFTGIIFEALSAESYKNAVPAYYDNVLSYKLVRDENNIDLVELIMDGRMYDFGYVYGGFESDGGGAAFWINDIVKGNGDLTSYYQSRKSNWESYMANVYALFDGYTGE